MLCGDEQQLQTGPHCPSPRLLRYPKLRLEPGLHHASSPPHAERDGQPPAQLRHHR